MHHPNENVRDQARKSLRKIGPLFSNICDFSYFGSIASPFIANEYVKFSAELLKEEGAIDTLIAMINTSENFLPNNGCILLGLLGKHPHIAKAIPVLKKTLQSKDIDRQIFAAEALGKIGDKFGVSHLSRLFLEKDDFKVRLHVLQALCFMGEIPQDVAEKIESFLETSSSVIVPYWERTPIEQILDTLADAGKVAFKTLPAITAFMLNKNLDYHNRNLAAGAAVLVTLGFPELAALKDWQGRYDYWEKFDDHQESVAARAISDINPAYREYVLLALVEVLKNGQEQTCRLAVKALREMGEKGIKALPLLLEKLRNTQQPNLKIEICQAIAAMGPKAAGALPELTKCLMDLEPSVRVSAANAIAALGIVAVSAAPEIRKWIPRENGENKAAFVSALGSISPRDGSEVPNFIQLLQDPEIKVRIAAAKALGKQGRAARDALPYLKILSESGEVLMRLAATEAIQNIHR